MNNLKIGNYTAKKESDYLVFLKNLVKTSNYRANPGDYVPCDTSKSGFIVMLPPLDICQAGDRVAIVLDYNGSGSKVMGAAWKPENHYVTVIGAGSDMIDYQREFVLKELGEYILFVINANKTAWFLM